MELTVILIAAATPVLAFTGALVGHWWNRTSAQENDRWRRREETMRLLRWAVELSTDPNEPRAAAGVIALTALLDSPLLDPDDVGLVAAVVTDIAVGDLPDGPGPLE